MRKKDLLALPTLPATYEMVQVMREDPEETKEVTHHLSYSPRRPYVERYKQCKYALYIRAMVIGAILKVAIFLRETIQGGRSAPDYEIYIDRKEEKYLTYEPKTGKWRKAKIDYLQFQLDRWRYTAKEWQSEEDRALVNRYFETGINLNIYQAVLNFQCSVLKEKLQQKHRTEIEQIDATMKEVPELPEAFSEWVKRDCFKAYLLYRPKRKGKRQEMYCTRCGEWMRAGLLWPGKPSHNMQCSCPNCGTKAIMKSWNKQKWLSDDVNVGLFQRLTDGSAYILRVFRAHRDMTHQKTLGQDSWEIEGQWMTEDYRHRVSMNFQIDEMFEWGFWKNTDTARWCHFRDNWMYGGHSKMRNVIFFTDNLQEEFRDRPFGNIDFKKLFDKGDRKEFDLIYKMYQIKDRPYIEYLQKSGLHRLAEEMAEGKWLIGEEATYFNKEAQSTSQFLRINEQRMHRLRQWNGGTELLIALQDEERSRGKLTDQNIRFLLNTGISIKQVIRNCLRTGMNMQRMLNYWQKLAETNVQGLDIKRVIGLYEDYLDMAEARGANVRDEIICHQPRMLEYHDRYLEEQNQKKDRDRDQEVNRRYPRIKEDHQDNEEHFGYKTKEYRFLVPEEAADITKEGRRQHHCVGASDTYLIKMNKGQTYILFLRKREAVQQPYYTLEVKWDGEIIQWYGAYDRRPDEEKIKKVLDQWKKQIKKRCEKEAAAAGDQPQEIRLAAAI